MIRRFSIKDADMCREIIKKCFDESVTLEEKARRFVMKRYTKKDYLERKSKEYPLFVYEEDKNILAVGAVEGNEIKKLYVDPHNQRKGIGTKMLKHLENVAINNGFNTLFLYSLQNSTGFFEKRGYSKKGEVAFKRDGIAIPTIEMYKSLR